MTNGERLIRMVERDFGDDLERAEAAFRGLTPPELQQEYGQSGHTCQQILDQYREDRRVHQRLLEYTKRLVQLHDELD